MNFICQPSNLQGTVAIPGSKSHTIRAVAIAAMAKGTSIIHKPLASADTLSAAHAAAALGATVRLQSETWTISGCAGVPELQQPEIDVGNSGTTLRVLLGLCSLLPTGTVTLTGDEQIRKRPAAPLVAALNELGAKIESALGNGCAPFTVCGKLHGGKICLQAPTSQYLTSLLLACPLAEAATEIEVISLNEKPYVQITLDWLAQQKINVKHEQMRHFVIPGRQVYKAFERTIPADFSSASFFLAAGALQDNSICCEGLDMTDSQPDKKVIDYLKAMGAAASISDRAVTISAKRLNGIEIDMNDTPDAVPIMAVIGCFAEGETRLRNVAHARIKETDRISVMQRELSKMGADIEELPDGLIIRRSQLHGTVLHGHGDHRVVMALAVAGLHAEGESRISTAEAAGVTFPDFSLLMTQLGADIKQDAS